MVYLHSYYFYYEIYSACTKSHSNEVVRHKMRNDEIRTKKLCSLQHKLPNGVAFYLFDFLSQYKNIQSVRFRLQLTSLLYKS